MNKITSLLIICAAFSTKSHCQEENSSIAQKKELKHEIAIDLLPVLNYSTNDAYNDFYIMYKYKIKNNKLRFSISSFSNSTNEIFVSGFPQNGYNTFQSYGYNKTTLSTIKLGIERSFGGKLINFIYGTDMLFGVAKSFSAPHYPTGAQFAPYERLFDDGGYYGTRNFAAGISPLIGCNLNITNNVGLGALITTDSYYNFGEQSFNVDPKFHLTLNVKF